MTKDEALRLALEFIASINPAFTCEAIHHSKKKDTKFLSLALMLQNRNKFMNPLKPH